MKLDLIELMRSAYFAGFEASAEGYNGEYPFDSDMNAISREMAEQADAAVLDLLSEVEPRP